MDISYRMLEIGRRKVHARGCKNRIHLGVGATLVNDDSFIEFLTLPAYERID